MRLTSDCVSTLGSRLHLLLDPGNARAFLPTYGRFQDTPIDLAVGVQCKKTGKRLALPLTRSEEHFPEVAQHTSMTRVRFVAHSLPEDLRFTVTFTSPFYPEDEKLSTAPFFYVDVTVERTLPMRWSHEETDRFSEGTVFFSLAGKDITVKPGKKQVDLSFSVTPTSNRRPEMGEKEGTKLEPQTIRQQVFVETHGARVVAEKTGTVQAADGLGTHPSIELDYSLADGPTTLSLIWAAYEKNKVFFAWDQWCAFRYCSYFKSLADVRDYAIKSRKSILKKCDFLDGLIDNWSLGKSYSNLAAQSFHSFLINTWWARTEKGRDWFSVWEGSCYYHSTIDVEYNNGMVYLALWPKLLKLLLNQWPSCTEPGTDVLDEAGKDTVYFCHDVGSGTLTGAQHYHHPMPVEENTNYLLLLLAYSCQTGDLSVARKHFKLLEKAVRFIVACDTTGNGFPDKGVANTIDDASPAVQYGREQTYLAVKSLAAVQGFAYLADKLGRKTESFTDWCDTLRQTFEKEAWLGDHYAVTLTRTTEGIVNAWSGDPLPEGELEGWDAYSIYTANGALIPMMAGLNLGLNLRRLQTDLDRATAETMTDMGCRHSSTGRPVVWISQNLWRDYVAAYLDVDMLNNVERYWNYQLQEGAAPIVSLFYDTSLTNNLCCYPRGATCFGAVFAAAGLVLNRLEGKLSMSPLRSTLDVPILPAVDWKKQAAPVLHVRKVNMRREVWVDNAELLTS